MGTVAALAIAVPIVSAALLALFGRWLPRWCLDAASFSVTVAVGVMSAMLMAASQGGSIVYWLGGWGPRDGTALGIALAVDPLGAGMAAFAATLFALAFAFSFRYFDSVGHLYHVLMLIFLSAMAGMALTGDLFNLFVFFELMSISAFALTGYKVEESDPLQGALNFAFTNTIAAFFILIGVGLVYGRTGALNLAQIGRALEGQDADGLIVVALLLLTCGFFVKAAIVPFHFWLSDAYAVAPTPVCILFSGVMSEMGLYALARVYFTAFEGSLGSHESGLQVILIAAGVGSALVGALMAFMQHHIKRLLAFATVSHSGLYLIGLGLFSGPGIAAAAVYAVGDGLTKAGLFVGAGVIINRFERAGEEDLHGAGRDLKVAGAVFLACGLALAGLPPFGTFAGKTMIEEEAKILGYAWMPYALTVVSILTSGAVLRVGIRVFLGLGDPAELEEERKRDPARRAEEEEEPETRPREARTPLVMILPGAVLAGLALLSGTSASFIHGAVKAAGSFEDGARYRALVFGLEHAPASVPAPPIHLQPGIPFAIASVVGAVSIAMLALYRTRLLPLAGSRVVNILDSPLLLLRRAHSGHVGDYVAWMMVGVVAFGAGFAMVVR